jgi:uncharacterized protein YdaU (DUF1376 family)
MKAKRLWMPLYVRDYFLDTRHLSLEQHGAYLMLIMYYWENGGIPDDDEQIAAILNIPVARWLLHRPVINRFFHRGWKHERIDIEIARANALIDKKRAAGTKGGLISSIRRARKPHLKPVK